MTWSHNIHLPSLSVSLSLFPFLLALRKSTALNLTSFLLVHLSSCHSPMFHLHILSSCTPSLPLFRPLPSFPLCFFPSAASFLSLSLFLSLSVRNHDVMDFCPSLLPLLLPLSP